MMNLKTPEKFYEAFIKTSQFLATITKTKHFWKRLELILKKFYNVDIFAFLKKENQGKRIQNETASVSGKLYNNLIETSQKLVKDVLENGIFASELVYLPESYFIIILPISKLNKIFGIIIIAHKTPELLPREILNIYLALGGLIETTYEKIFTTEKLKDYQKDLEKAVEERTSELVEVNRQLKTEISAKEKAEKTLKEFVSMVSHELRTPISVLVQSINNLKKYSKKINLKLRKKLFNLVARNSVLLSELVEDLLIIARIDEQGIILKWDKYSLFELVDDVLELMEPLKIEKGIKIELEGIKDIFSFGDRGRISQIFRIFIDNALKYSKEEGTIKIKAIDHYLGDYNPHSIDGFLIQFIDYGIGIKGEEIPKLFTRFFRSSEVKNITGTGLGLAIAKELTKLHKGTIYAESELGRGTTFSIFFPRMQLLPYQSQT